MPLIRAFIFLVFTSCAFCYECGVKSESTGVIFGGVQDKQWPWLVRLFEKKNKIFLCSSSLISNKHLLTAAHCVKGMDSHRVRSPRSLFSMLGGTNISDFEELDWIQRDISQIYVHEEFGVKRETEIFDADIAVLMMATSVKFGQTVRKICLPSPNDRIAGVEGSVVGHGLDESNKLQDIARYINVTAVDDVTCIRKNKQLVEVVSSRGFCAGGENGKIACRGDSGGGFYVQDKNVWKVSGIISVAALKNDDSCDENVPTGFTNVSAFHGWIQNILNLDNELTRARISSTALTSTITTTTSAPSTKNDLELLRVLLRTPAVKPTLIKRVTFNLNRIGPVINERLNMDTSNEETTQCNATLIRNSLDISKDELKELIKLSNTSDSNGLSLVKKFTSSVMSQIFFKQTLRLTTEEESHIKEIIKSSLKNVQTLQRIDGSFDLWKTPVDLVDAVLNADHDNLDLTAFMVKVLVQLKKDNPSFDNIVITKAMEYIKSRQRADGSFRNNGNPRFKDLAKNLNINDIQLTAFILVSILESDELKENYQQLVNKALSFVNSKYYEILHVGTNYERALTFYGNTLAGKDHQLMLNKLQKESIKRNGTVYWNLNKLVESPKKDQVEISSYVLLGLTKLKKYEEANEIVKFLMREKNPKGGFTSTTDTVLGLQALAEISKHLYSKNTNIIVKIRNDLNQETQMDVNNFKKKGSVTLMLKKNLLLEARGIGVAIFEVSC